MVKKLESLVAEAAPNSLEATFEDQILPNENQGSIRNAYLTWPTIITTVIASVPAALVADTSLADHVRENWGVAGSLLTSLGSDMTQFLIYNTVFPITFGALNYKRYRKEDAFLNFDFGACISDLTLKVLPAGAATAIFCYHLPRNLIQTSAMHLGLRPFILLLLLML